MGIDAESDVSASLVIGPTSTGMVRIYVESEGVELPMDFEPDEALEMAEELRAAAEAVRAAGERRSHGGQGRSGGKRKGSR